MLSFIKYDCTVWAARHQPLFQLYLIEVPQNASWSVSVWAKKKHCRKMCSETNREKNTAQAAWQEAVCGLQQCHKHSTAQYSSDVNFMLFWKSFSWSTSVIFLSTPKVILAVWMHHLLRSNVSHHNKKQKKTKISLGSRSAACVPFAFTCEHATAPHWSVVWK